MYLIGDGAAMLTMCAAGLDVDESEREKRGGAHPSTRVADDGDYKRSVPVRLLRRSRRRDQALLKSKPLILDPRTIVT